MKKRPIVMLPTATALGAMIVVAGGLRSGSPLAPEAPPAFAGGIGRAAQQATTRGPEGKASAPPSGSESAEPEWSMTIKRDATIIIMHKGVPVVRAEHISWSDSTHWVESRFQAENPQNGRARLTGEVKALDIQAEGAIDPLGDNELAVTYAFSVSRGRPNVYGLVIQWNCTPNSPSFDQKPGLPVLLEDNRGWMWPVGNGENVRVVFDQPLPKIYFEANQRNVIRAFLFTGRVEPGIKTISYSVELPRGARIVPSLEERYGKPDTKRWFRDALAWDGSPIDLSFLNAQDRPAGSHGFLKAEGDRLVFEDGTPARFWGANLAAASLFVTPKQNVPHQARRMSKLGFNLMRIVHHDAPWVEPNIFAGSGKKSTRALDPASLDKIDWWIKCLKDAGIYVWLELVYQRKLTPSDGVKLGYDEIKRHEGKVEGFNYLNEDLTRLMQEFQHKYLGHVNRYTRLAYKDDPAVAGILITNENDLTHHFGNMMLPANHNEVHSKIFMAEAHAFAKSHGLPGDQIWKTWEPGPGKIFLNDLEHRFNQVMIDDLREMGVRAPLATTNSWGECPVYSLPALSDGDIIDVHSYGVAEEMSVNPRYAANFLTWIGAAQVSGKPLSITEWNTQIPAVDRFASPLYLASIGSLQGWDMPMLFNYSLRPLKPPSKVEAENRTDKWEFHNDPALCGLMPAAALAFRMGHVSPSRSPHCLMLDRDHLLGRDINPRTSATIRTLLEQSQISIGWDAIKELPWLKPAPAAKGATIVTDPDHDFIPADQSFVRSDTGELVRNWKYGIQTINSPKTQAVSGWVGGKTLRLGDVTIRVENPKAVVALTSVDDQPLASSRYILVTALARAVDAKPGQLPYLSEPVVATIALKSKTSGIKLLALSSSGRVQQQVALEEGPSGLTFQLPTRRGTHWYALRADDVSTDEPEDKP